MPEKYPNIFLSGSFAPEDRELLEWFEQILWALEFEVRSAKETEPRPPAEKIREMIQRSSGVVAILTRRSKVDGRDAWTPPAWTQNEIGIAYDCEKPIVSLIEIGVEAEGLIPLIGDYIRFDRSNLVTDAPKIIRHLL
jgi:hypothetical protein